MPWKETSAVDERMKFVALFQSGEFTVTELCERFGVSRRVGHKWLRRYEEEGVQGLFDRSRAPRSRPGRTALDAEQLLIAARLERPHWGPKKLLPWLQRQHPDVKLPSRSTAHDILKRHGLVRTRKRRRRTGSGPTGPLRAGQRPGEVWCADFKGQFRLRNGQLCYPLTISDHHSRFLIRCDALSSTASAPCLRVFEDAFEEHGLPEVIRTDNGTPFASTGLAGLSRLSAWWVRLGIEPQRITPGHPQENARHERMHRTLKDETTRPPGRDMGHQQELFDAFQHEYNVERPHEGLEGETPGSRYTPSDRPLPEDSHDPEYPGHFELRRVSRRGRTSLFKQPVHIGEAFAGQLVGLEPIEHDRWRIHFFDWHLGVFDESTGRVERYGPRNKVRRPHRRSGPRASASRSHAEHPGSPQGQPQPETVGQDR